jgi:hypothetical protein
LIDDSEKEINRLVTAQQAEENHRVKAEEAARAANQDSPKVKTENTSTKKEMEYAKDEKWTQKEEWEPANTWMAQPVAQSPKPSRSSWSSHEWEVEAEPIAPWRAKATETQEEQIRGEKEKEKARKKNQDQRRLEEWGETWRDSSPQTRVEMNIPQRTRRQLQRKLPNPKPGDWFCSGCGDLQFRRNQRCRICERSRSRRSPTAGDQETAGQNPPF